jgi:acetolactate synthase-1/2/3 large subunit
MQALSDYLVEQLCAYGVDTVFGIPGVHTVELYRGLVGRAVRHVAARHEQSLGFMADGYARVSGKPGVCFVITGPGLSNILTAMGQAYADSIPMLVISGVNPMGRLGSGNGYLHELPNQQALAREVSAFSHTITHPGEVPQVLARAFAVFTGGRPRPVHIEIPLNLMQAAMPPQRKTAPLLLRPGSADTPSLARATQALTAAKRPLLIAGGGSIAAAESMQALAETLDAPVVMTINARGLLSDTHPLALSASPSFPAIRALVADSDVVLAIGTELGPTDFDCYDREPFSVAGQLIRIEIDAQQMVRNCQPDIALLGDARASTEALLALCRASAQGAIAGVNAATQHTGAETTLANLTNPTALDSAGANRASHARAQGLQELDATMRDDITLLHALRDALPEALWVGDSTRLVYAGNMGFAARRPRSWFNASVGFGALGYGMPAAIGAALADSSHKVICLAGDGGFQFTLGEMGTAMEVGANLVVLLLNNSGYGEIKAAMKGAGVEPIGVDLHTPDFVALALSYGWNAQRFDYGIDVARLAQTIHAASGPTLIELTV